MAIPVFKLALLKAIPLIHTGSSTQKLKNYLDLDMSFLYTSYDEYTKVENPVVVTTSYEGSDEEEELKTVPVVTNHNNVNVVSDSKSDSSEEHFKNDGENFLMKILTAKSKRPLKPLSTQKWYKQ